MSKEIMELANVAAESIMKLTKENEKLKEENHGFIQLSKSLQDEVKGLRETMGEPANDFGSRVWDILYDEDYCPTSYGEAVSFIKDIIKENEELEKQIPKKPRKCLSQNDKEVLEEILHNLEYPFGTEEHHNDGGGWFYEAKVNLLKRLIK